jgi:hypothetical protein
LSDEGDPYLQTPSMCTQIQVRAYGEQKKAKMISARAHAYCVCLAACTPNKGAKLLQKPQQLSPRGELGVMASSDDITHPRMDRPASNSVHHLCEADCWRPVSVSSELQLRNFTWTVPSVVRKYGDMVSHTQMRPRRYVVVTTFSIRASTTIGL